ncbi:hypothetical protein RCL_jg14410.t1 [Rhizophagus clarus]|uniref:Uncharacterized protein n=1 Tax=Rhizophagus clarus TaxID=94130 RepID=A0A8H3LRH6_9GLOM|nr:hypothetical protein RCL_jg14410.t1 [Rhizophagus clarus]
MGSLRPSRITRSISNVHLNHDNIKLCNEKICAIGRLACNDAGLSSNSCSQLGEEFPLYGLDESIHLNDKLRMKPADDESKIDDEFSLRQTMAMNSRPTMTTLIGMIYFGIFEHENAMHF